MAFWREQLIGKVPKLDTDDGHQVYEQCIKFGTHGSSCIETIEENDKR